jgi:hypothetical protein
VVSVTSFKVQNCFLPAATGDSSLQLCISSKTMDIATLVLKRSLTIENKSKEKDCRSINELSLIETLKSPKRKTAGIEKNVAL